MTLSETLKQTFILWLARRLPPCDEITRLLSEARDRKLSVRERLTTRLHLWTCVWCRRYEQQLTFLHDVLHRHAEHLADGPSPPFMPDEARDRIKAALEADL